MNRTMQQALLRATPTARAGGQAEPSVRGAGLISAGGILAALGAASCCVVPFARHQRRVDQQPDSPRTLPAALRGGHFRLPRLWLLPGLPQAQGSLC